MGRVRTAVPTPSFVTQRVSYIKMRSGKADNRLWGIRAEFDVTKLLWH